MTARPVISPDSELTPHGTQTVLPSVRPITARQRLALAMGAALRAFKPQKPMNIGLFDKDARNQLNLF